MDEKSPPAPACVGGYSVFPHLFPSNVPMDKRRTRPCREKKRK